MREEKPTTVFVNPLTVFPTILVTPFAAAFFHVVSPFPHSLEEEKQERREMYRDACILCHIDQKNTLSGNVFLLGDLLLVV